LANLDSLDLRLIRELDRNARASFTELSKRLNAPSETVRYRLNALIESGIISGFYTVIDAGQLGCSVHKALIKLHNVDEAKVDTIVAYLTNHPFINWVVRMDGNYDLSFTMWARRIGEVSAFIDELKARHYSHVARIALAVNIEADFLTRDPAQRKRRDGEKQARYTVPKQVYHVDEIDFGIMKQLSGNPRIAATAISEVVGVTSETVAKRISNLERRKVIGGYRIVTDPSKIGELNFYVLIYLNLVSADKIAKFVQYCRQHPLVNYLIKALGEWDYELNVEVKSYLEFRSFMMDITREFADIVRDYESMPVSTIYKFMIMPPGAENFSRSNVG